MLRYRQPALVEKFINGKEISVGIIGNSQAMHVFPPLEFRFDDTNSNIEKIRSYENKWGGKREKMIRAELPPDVIDRLIYLSRTAFLVTDCIDYARLDFRLDFDLKIYLLEVNYNPGIGPNAHGLNNTLTMMASFDGYSFEDLVEKIILIALKRYGKI